MTTRRHAEHGASLPWSYRPAFDGMRALAIYLVLVFHAGLTLFSGGFVGVDFFFVLSGFLVTSILLDELARTGRLELGRFYARRVRRLLPAAVLVIVATSLVSVLFISPVRRVPLVGDAQSALLYVSNWRFLAQSNDYFATSVHESPFLHFWSLSIEEQFYLFFPVLLLALFWLRRRVRFALVAGLTVGIAASVASELFWAFHDQNHAYYGTDARLYQLLAGALAAVAYRDWRSRRTGATGATAAGRRSRLFAAAGLAALVLVASGALDIAPAWRGLLATIASVSLVLGVATDDSQPLARFFSLPLVAYLGRISYGTYLWHWPVILVLMATLRSGPVVVVALAAGAATAFAALSYEILEMPIRRSRGLSRARFPTLLVGVTMSALVAAVLVPPVLSSDRTPAIAQATKQRARASVGRPVADDINWKRYIHDRGTHETLCAGTDTSECTAASGDGPTVLLVGDSHGSMLAPTLTKIAEELDWTLLLDIQGACPWQVGLYDRIDSPEEQQSCLRSRHQAYEDLIEAADVDVVLLTSLSRDDEEKWGDVIVAEHPRPHETLNERLLRTTRRTLRMLTAQDVHTLIFQSIIVPPDDFDPLDCLSTATSSGECVVTVPREPLSDSIYRTAATGSDLVSTVNINSFACPTAPECDPLQGRIPVWRDSHHYTPKVLLRHREDIQDAVLASGAFDDPA